jgi:hypothetical protein
VYSPASVSPGVDPAAPFLPTKTPDMPTICAECGKQVKRGAPHFRSGLKGYHSSCYSNEDRKGWTGHDVRHRMRYASDGEACDLKCSPWPECPGFSFYLSVMLRRAAYLQSLAAEAHVIAQHKRGLVA